MIKSRPNQSKSIQTVLEFKKIGRKYNDKIFIMIQF